MEEKKKTIIYTSPNCGYCLLLKDWLKEKNIEFEEIDISQDIEKIQEIEKKTGQKGIPVLETPKGEILVGFNQLELEKIFR